MYDLIAAAAERRCQTPPTFVSGVVYDYLRSCGELNLTSITPVSEVAAKPEPVPTPAPKRDPYVIKGLRYNEPVPELDLLDKAELMEAAYAAIESNCKPIPETGIAYYDITKHMSAAEAKLVGPYIKYYYAEIMGMLKRLGRTAPTHEVFPQVPSDVFAKTPAEPIEDLQTMVKDWLGEEDDDEDG